MSPSYGFRRLARKIPTISRRRGKIPTSAAYSSPLPTPQHVSASAKQASLPPSPSSSPPYTYLSTTASKQDPSSLPKTQAAFIITIEGALLDSTTLLPGAKKTLRYLSHENIPYMLLASGESADSEEEAAEKISNLMGFRIPPFRIFFPYTLFRGSIHDPQPPITDNILVLGSPSRKIKALAESYGFGNVHTSQKLQKQVRKVNITSILVFNQAENWKSDIETVVDLLLSSSNEDADGKDGVEMPFVYWCEGHSDWVVEGVERLSLEKGGFRAALEAAWYVETGDALDSYTQSIPLFLEGELFPNIDTPARRAAYLIDGTSTSESLCKITEYQSAFGVRWEKVSVENGQNDAKSAHESVVVAKSVEEAVMWSLANASNDIGLPEIPPRSPSQQHEDIRTNTTTTETSQPRSFASLPPRSSDPEPGQPRDDSRTNTTTKRPPNNLALPIIIPPLNLEHNFRRSDDTSRGSLVYRNRPCIHPLCAFTEELESQLSQGPLPPPPPPRPLNTTVLRLNKALPYLPWESQHGESADRPLRSILNQTISPKTQVETQEFIAAIRSRLQELRESRKAFDASSLSKKKSFGGSLVSQEIAHRSLNAMFESLQDPIEAYDEEFDLVPEQGVDFTLYDEESEWSGLNSVRGSEDGPETMSWPPLEFSPILGASTKRCVGG
ncbi:hypothetical protein BJ875DRAFT_485985 [Amylocarpus encephaloides]|uniref:Uncharacterized protein n=1 Tax=Amylocarpus encephaloides TaxID=45428 RepID=A0A9P7YFZ3_9HELO|nr:hypothetical protein BJ875DRAFT_485985 [Amylocarpus encephaloides]